MAKALLLVESGETGWNLGPEEDSKLLQLLAQAGLSDFNIYPESVRLLSTGTAPRGVLFETKEMTMASLGRLANTLVESQDVIAAKIFVPFAVINGSAKKE